MINVFLSIPGRWFFVSFLVWCYCFYQYLFFQAPIFEDAVSYYDHTKYFVEYLAKGIYPLWDHTWTGVGVANDFFLRRIGAFNPLYSIMAIVVKLGVPFHVVYLWGMAIYWWLGVMFFYLFLRNVLNHQGLVAYGATLLLAFSSLSMRMFDSYMHLVIVPTIIFFYFFFMFLKSPSSYLMWGMVVSLSIVLGTYIPFYFMIFFIVVLIITGILYAGIVKSIFGKVIAFIQKQFLVVFLGVVVLVGALLPSAMFYMKASQGDISLPARKGTNTAEHALVVDKNSQRWGTMEELAFASYFRDLRLIRFGVIYIPVVGLIIVAMTMFVRLNRVRMTIGLILMVMLLLSSPGHWGIYNLFRDHLFIFKMIRNAHFFCWFFMIPLFIIWIASLWDALSKELDLRKNGYLIAAFIGLLLSVFLIFMYSTPVMITTIIATGIITTLLLGRIWDKCPKNLIYGLLLVAVVIQPIEIYSYLRYYKAANRDKHEFIYQKQFEHTKSLPALSVDAKNPAGKASVYFTADIFMKLINLFPAMDINHYVRHSLLLYNQVLPYRQDSDLSQRQLHDVLMLRNPLALVAGNPIKTLLNDSNVPVEVVNKNSPHIKVVDFNPNYLKLNVSIHQDKFLVYNDIFNDHWQAFIDGKKVNLYRTNVAFKGVVLPSGRYILEFKYHQGIVYFFNMIMQLVFLLLLGYLISRFRKEINHVQVAHA